MGLHRLRRLRALRLARGVLAVAGSGRLVPTLLPILLLGVAAPVVARLRGVLLPVPLMPVPLAVRLRRVKR